MLFFSMLFRRLGLSIPYRLPPPVPIPTIPPSRFRFRLVNGSGVGLRFPANRDSGLSVSGRDGMKTEKQQRKPTNPTDPDQSGLSRYRTDWFRAGSRFGFPAKSGVGTIGIGSGRDYSNHFFWEQLHVCR